MQEDLLKSKMQQRKTLLKQEAKVNYVHLAEKGEKMQNYLFEKAPVHKAYFKFALPVVFSMVISLVYNMVDTYFIARTGNTSLVAGVSIGAPEIGRASCRERV